MRKLRELREARRTTSGAGAAVPLAHYDAPSVAEIGRRLAGLSDDEARAVRAFEAAHRNRKTLIAELDRRLGAGADGGAG